MKIFLLFATLLVANLLNAQVLNLRTSPKGDSISINASEIKRIAASGSGAQIWFSANSQLVMETPSAISAASCEAFIVVNIPGTVYIGKKFIVKVTKSGSGAKIFTSDGFADITTTTPYWEVIEQTSIPAECGGSGGGDGIQAIEFNDRNNGISGGVSSDSILSLFLDPTELGNAAVAVGDSVMFWDASADTMARTDMQSVVDLVATSSSGGKLFRSTDNFATLSPTSPTPVNGDFGWDTRRGNLWQRSGGSFTTRVTYENGSLASTAFSTTNDTLLFDASLYNRAQLITPTSGTTIVVSAPTNIASQAVGEVFQIIIQNSNDSTATVNWNAVFGKWDMTSVTTTVTAGTTIGYLWQTVTDGAEGVVLASLNDLGGGNPTGAAGGDLTGTYPNPSIANNAVTGAKIAAGTIDSTDIATGGIGNTDLASDIVTASKIAADAVGSSEIAAGAVGNSELDSNAVDSTKAAGLAPSDIYFDANGTFPQIIVGFSNQGGAAQSQDGAGSQVSFNSSSPTGKYNLQIIDGTVTGADLAQSAIDLIQDSTKQTLDNAYNNFGASASKVTVDAAQGQTGGLEIELSATNNPDFILDMQGTGDIVIQDGGLPTHIFSDNGGIVLNEQGVGGTADIRMESDANQNTFFLDVSTDRIGVKTNAPATELEVIGGLKGSYLYLGDGLTNAFIFPFTTSATSANTAGKNISFYSYETLSCTQGNFAVRGSAFAGTTGNHSIFWAGKQFLPTSGSASLAAYEVGSDVNQTGGASGIFRGFYHNPNIIAAADNRAFESTSGAVYFGQYGSTSTHDATPTKALGINSSNKVVSYSLPTTGCTKDITQTSHGFSVGDAIYWNGSAYAKIQGNFGSTDMPAGIVYTVTSANVFTLATCGILPTDFSLADGVYYATNSGLSTTPSEPQMPVLKVEGSQSTVYPFPVLSGQDLFTLTTTNGANSIDEGETFVLKADSVLVNSTNIGGAAVTNLATAINRLENGSTYIVADGVADTIVIANETYTVTVNTNTNAETVRLPAPGSTYDNVIVWVKQIGSASNTVTISAVGGGSVFYDTDATSTSSTINAGGNSKGFQCVNLSGTRYWIVI